MVYFLHRRDSYYFCGYCFQYFITSYKKQHLKSLKHQANVKYCTDRKIAGVF